MNNKPSGRIIKKSIGSRQKAIGAVKYLSKEYYDKLITEWNVVEAVETEAATIHAVFEQRVQDYNTHIAVVFGEVRLSYGELNNRANRLGHYLQNNYGIRPDDLVVLCLDRSEHMLIAILGVLKAGGAYIPVDPAYPADRIQHIINDTGAKAVLTNECHQQMLQELTGTAVLGIDTAIFETELKRCSETNVVSKSGSSSLAYVIYTSGTTGQPKGVMVEHGNVCRLFSATEKWYGFNEQDVWTLFHAYVFDFSVWEIWGALCYGGKLLIPDHEQTRDPERFYKLCETHGVTVLNQTPSAFYQFSAAAQLQDTKLTALRYVIFGGEALNLAQLRSWYQVYEKDTPKLVNMYGITETTVHVTYKSINPAELDKGSLIGQRIVDLQLYVLDQEQQLLPVGAVGELYVGGSGVTRGYLNRPELTAERFIANPFQSEEDRLLNRNGRLYKTGDLVRYLTDGTLEYIGRNDFQVKIRGFRIELGEIEHALSNHPEISQSVVLALEQENGNKYLAGYYVAKAAIESEQLNQLLGSVLPAYMVPSVFVHLDHMPLTINGKLDRKALPVPGFSSTTVYRAPETELQQSICIIWAEVLGIPVAQIGIDDDFFGLGGNSITAIKLVSRINQELGTGFRIVTLFAQRSIARLSVFISESVQQEVLIHAAPVNFATDQLLSFAQERLWFIETYEGGTNAYNIPMVLGLGDKVDTDILCSALLSVIYRHEVLRSQIKTDGSGRIYQQVIDPAVQPLVIHDENYEDQTALNTAIGRTVAQVFDLVDGYPISINFYRCGTSRYLSIVVHHIAFDGWSSGVFIREVLHYYHLHSVTGSLTVLPELEVQYKEYALWQRAYLSGNVLEEQLDYWISRLQGFETLHLPTDYIRPLQQSYAGADVAFTLDAQTSAGLRATAAALGVSMYSLLLSGYYLMLQSYSGQEDLVVGTAVSNRHHRQTQDMIGFFVNTLALRCEVNTNETLEQFITHVGNKVEEAQGYQDLPFERLVEALKVVKDTSRHPVFQVMFSMDSFGIEEASGLSGLFFPYMGDLTYPIAKFDLSLSMNNQDGLIGGNFNYATALFDAATIAGYVKTYQKILVQLAEALKQKEKRIHELVYLDQADHQKQVYDWNKTTGSYPERNTIHGVFEQRVREYNAHTAIVSGGVKLSYGELNDRANRLGHYLQNCYGVQANELVVLCLDRSEHMLIAILGVLKTGAAYVPIDPGYPAERIQHILNDTAARIVLTNEINQHLFQDPGDAIAISIDTYAFETELKAHPETNVLSEGTAASLAYVIYTSGTTGQPKGVMVEHYSLINLTTDLQVRYGFANHEVLVQFANYVFDASVEQIFLALLNGHTLLLLKKDSWHDEHTFIQTLAENNAGYIEVTPSFLSQYALEKVASLTKINAGGEALTLKLLNRLKDKVTFINSYGPTETTVTSIVNVGAQHTYIGRPVANTTTYVLDKQQRPLPIGATGELYIGGIGVSRGYLNQPELTAERFIINPFQSEEDRLLNRNARLYKTGDLVRYLPDGNLEYLGRNDFQVKIRGYRIELGEIEQVLNAYPGISQSVVLALEQENGNKYLVGYYVAEKMIESEFLIRILGGVLPDYMVPSVFVYLEKMPLTINGKLNKKALPVPVFTGESSYHAPETTLQQSLCEIWSEVLGIPAVEISIHDDFFRLGGDSIVSIRLSGRIRQRLGIQVSVKDIFIHKNISQLSSYLSTQPAAVTIESEQGELNGALGLLPVQAYFFSQLDRGLLPTYNHWNQSFLVTVPQLDEAILEESVRLLLGYHDQLRSGYRKHDGGYAQYYRAVWDFKIDRFEVLGLSVEAIDAKFTAWQSDFDIFGDRLFRIGYVSGYADGSARLYFAFHHLLIDTVSWRILTTDLYQLYTHVLAHGISVSAQTVLGNKGTSYRQWVTAISGYAELEGALAETAYWKSLESGILAGNMSLSGLVGNEVQQVSFALDQELTGLLLRDSNQKYKTRINDILLSALGLALHKLTGNMAHGILLEGHGREPWSSMHDLSGTTGWFTSLYPFLLTVDPDAVSGSVVKVKEGLRAIPNHGIGYGALLGYQDDLLPVIGFNYLGQFDEQQGDMATGWAVSAERSGSPLASDNNSNLLLDINGGVIGGMLRFSLSGYLPLTMLDTLSNDYRDALVLIVKELSHATRSYLSPSDIGGIISAAHLDALQLAGELDGVYLANSLQEGFIYQSLHYGEADDAYIVQQLWDYHQHIDVAQLHQAWVYAQQRYSSLRLGFDWAEELVQVIASTGTVDWRYQDLSLLSATEQESAMALLQSADRATRYDLSRPGLFRIYLVRRSAQQYSCLFSSHHAILDGWSTPLLLAYVHECYLQLLKGEVVKIERDEVYGVSQNYLQSNRRLSEAYWRDYLGSGTLIQPDLSSLMQPGQRHVDLAAYRHILHCERYQVSIEGSKYERMKSLAASNGFTVNALLQYLWHKQLSVYGHSSLTVTGMVVSGRNLPVQNIESAVGLYINTLPVIYQHGDGLVVSEVQRLQGHINEVNSHSEMRLGGLGNAGSGRLFSSLFVYENYPVGYDSGKFSEFSITAAGALEKMDYPLCIVAYEQQGKAVLRLEYAGELFDTCQISAFMDGLVFYLDQLLDDHGLEVRALRHLDLGSTNLQLNQWNRIDFDTASTDTFCRLFERQVVERGDEIAIVCGDESLSYTALNHRSNQLAHYLQQEHNLRKEELVALCLDRSTDMLIAILGIQKAGGAYVPIDPGYPSDRMHYILGDTQARVVLTHEKYCRQLEESGTAAVILLDGEGFLIQQQDYPVLNLTSVSGAADLAYVIYTSGTTGQPKGVMVEQRAYINLLNYYKTTYFAEGQAIDTFSVTNYVFDIWGLEYGLPLISGGFVELSDSGFRNLDTKGYSFVQFTPSLLSAKLDDICFTQSDLKLFVGGEALNIALLEDIFGRSPELQVINVYGPTETTIWSLNRVNVKDDFNTAIGYPIANTTTYVLDENLQLLPVGVIGELYIGGTGVSRGYLNRPELTAERFISNPFQTEKDRLQNCNGQLYKTGDLVRYQNDGTLEYIGRNDFQVKVRGYRIELGEIEHALNLYPDISQSVVLALEQENGNKYLAGYYVAEEAIPHELLTHTLARILPDHMVPSVFVHLDRMPLTINGKLDRKALPAPGFNGNVVYQAPETELQHALCRIWAEVLSLPIVEIGIQDDFFELGGNSITAIKLISKINQQLGITLRLTETFMHRSVSSLSAFLEHRAGEKQMIIPLNEAIGKPDLFMVHPGNGGCEVYTSLAKGLADQYHCYGVDSYNLYHTDQIDNLTSLATYYLQQIDEVKQKNHQDREVYNLLGWSLGGQIALEMAAILEARGIKKISIFLLDTILHQGGPREVLTDEMISMLINQQTENYPEIKDFEQKARTLLSTEHELIGQRISSMLNHTRVLLFKAAETGIERQTNVSEKQCINEPDNQIGKVLSYRDQLQIINMDHVQHNNILEDEAKLLLGIKEFLNT